MSKLRDGILGVAIGDMLGVPVEFMRREALDDNPVTGPRAHGSHDQPLGAWSDDTSLTLALADALAQGYNLKNIAQNFLNWWINKDYTSHGYIFDIGEQTRNSLNHLLKIIESEDYEALEYLHFDANENTNGNGSLMRTLPLYFTIKDSGVETSFTKIYQVSALTHPHIWSALSCLMYLIMIDELVNGRTPAQAYTATCSRMKAFFAQHEEYQDERQHFTRLLDSDITTLTRDQIESGGYVIETLEASFWCFLTTTSYSEAILTAVNLGIDTDTTASVTGGLAGIYYGETGIPTEWLSVLANEEEINAICDNLNNKSYESKD